MHRKNSNVLVVHCSDPRFQAAYRTVIDGLDEYYDLLALPGASKAIVDYPNVIEYIKLLISLHGCKTIHVFDHIECGAFGFVEDEKKTHRRMLYDAEAALKKSVSDFRFVPHLLGKSKEIELG